MCWTLIPTHGDGLAPANYVQHAMARGQMEMEVEIEVEIEIEGEMGTVGCLLEPSGLACSPHASHPAISCQTIMSVLTDGCCGTGFGWS